MQVYIFVSALTRTLLICFVNSVFLFLCAVFAVQMKMKWKPGTSVRALYSKDNKYYEAIIKTVIDNKYAIVRFIGN